MKRNGNCQLCKQRDMKELWTDWHKSLIYREIQNLLLKMFSRSFKISESNRNFTFPIHKNFQTSKNTIQNNNSTAQAIHRTRRKWSGADKIQKTLNIRINFGSRVNSLYRSPNFQEREMLVIRLYRSDPNMREPTQWETYNFRQIHSGKLE